MSVLTAYLRSKVARRVLLLFILCALLPVTGLAVISFTHVTSHLYEQSHTRLRQASKATGMAIYERLMLLEAEMRVMVAQLDTTTEGSSAGTFGRLIPTLSHRYKGLAVRRDGVTQVLFGQLTTPPEETQAEQRHVRAGKTLVTVKHEGDYQARVLMSRLVDPDRPERGIFQSEIAGEYLWLGGNDVTLPARMELCVFDDRLLPLFCSLKKPVTLTADIRTFISPSSTSYFEWQDATEGYLASFWSIPLRFQFFPPQWTVVLSEPKSGALAPLESFKWTFVLVIILTLCVVTLFSVNQIRSSLDPLGKLEEGTRRIAARDFASRVSITSDDEFGALARSFNTMAERLGCAEENRVRLAAIVESSEDAIISKTLGGIVTSWNRAAERTFGFTADEVIGKPIGFIIPPDRLDEESQIIERVKQGGHVTHFETVRRRKDRKEIQVALTLSPIEDGVGTVIGISKIARDITEQKGLEAQFRQSQKMQGVGQLASGIAHDFNNLLTVINSYSEMVLEDPDFSNFSSPFLRDGIEQIKEAGHRASVLTRQLLMFSRQQALEPKVLDLNEVVSNIAKLLHRLIGEDITLVLRPHPALGRVKVDPGQMEQIIMNLAVNARDAMPDGGQLTIETGNVELPNVYTHQHVLVQPGAYVVLAVSDTGCGMDAATQARILEPFFTTKGPGRGTGLGLATVDGIVKQSSGHILVYSELGKGTTFKIYLPQVEDTLELPGPIPVAAEALRGDETVLIVEDEEMVLALAQTILERYGYRVLATRNVQGALRFAQEDLPIDLLLSDTIMPGMNGPQLAKHFLSFRPKTKVLYMSGYTDKVIGYIVAQEPGTAFLQKPFTPQTLAHKVREVLNAIPRQTS